MVTNATALCSGGKKYGLHAGVGLLRSLTETFVLGSRIFFSYASATILFSSANSDSGLSFMTKDRSKINDALSGTERIGFPP